MDALPYDHPQPIYILLDHFNGKTKDCLEVQIKLADHFTAVRRNRFSASRSANLKSRQNSSLPGGLLTDGRKRPVTISLVSHADLIADVCLPFYFQIGLISRICARDPRKGSLACSLACSLSAKRPSPRLSVNMTSGVAMNGIALFVKSRHGPFSALMSMMSKLRGKESPAYWYVFRKSSINARAGY